MLYPHFSSFSTTFHKNLYYSDAAYYTNSLKFMEHFENEM